jgi:hypothetical protein
LVSVNPNYVTEVLSIFCNYGLDKLCEPIGTITERAEKDVNVI